MKKLSTNILLIGTGIDCPDIEYASGFRADGPVVFMRKGRRQYLVVPQFELGRARNSGRHVEVVTPDTLNLSGGKRKGASEWALRLLQKCRVRMVTVPAFFPYGAAKRLERAGIRVRVAKGEVFPERAVKTRDEVRKIRESQQAAVIAIRAAVAMIARSEISVADSLRIKGRHLTSEDIQRTITRVLLDHDCLCKEAIVAGGERAADPHDRGEGPLYAHESIIIDIFPQHMKHGYWGDLTRTIVKGKPSSRLKRMYYAVKAAQSAALNRVKAGVKCATVHRHAVEEFERRGFKTEVVDKRAVGFTHSTGHGVGLAIHEAPSISAGDQRLKSGNVITIEPGLYYPDIGGVRIEDTIVVTPGGWRYLVPCEKRFEV